MTTKLVRSVAGLVILTVLAVQLSRATGRGVNIVNYLSYLTIFSNACAAAVLVCLAARPSLVDSEKFTVFRGAVTPVCVSNGIVLRNVHLAGLQRGGPTRSGTFHPSGRLDTSPSPTTDLQTDSPVAHSPNLVLRLHPGERLSRRVVPL